MKKISLILLLVSFFAVAEDARRIPSRRVINEDALTSNPEQRAEGEGRTLKTSPVLMKDSDWVPSWRPQQQRKALGIETSSSSFGVLGTNAISYTHWTSATKGFEYLFGYSKTADSFTETLTVTQSNTSAANQSLTEATAYSGTKNPHNFLLGLTYRDKIHQSDWLQIYWGLTGAIQYSTSASYTTGTSTKTTTNISDSDTYSIEESADFGNTTRKGRLQVFIGPKFGSEFYLRWFPQLALGFATGVLTSFGTPAETVAVTHGSSSETTQVNNGVVTPPAPTPETSVTTKNPGDFNGSTFGIGGQTFSFTGQFTIRYVW
ncbi:hypothetical protein EBQ90_08615 [bacterium]|nr:hypothetical protein [bacterium]